MSVIICLCTIILLYSYYLSHAKVPILMYHRIDNVLGDRNTVAPEKFEQQLKYLAENGYHSLTMDEVLHHYENCKPLPKPSVVLTFDDGYVDNFTNAMPLLEKYHMRGNVFVISDYLGKENKWEDFGKELTITMNEDQLLKWQAAGHYVGCHTYSHPFLSKLTEEEQLHQFATSKEKLEKLLGRPVNCICYPYGDFNDITLETAKKAGFHSGLAIFRNAPLHRLNLLALPRIPIPSGQKMWEFKLKVSRIHLLFVLLRQAEQALKSLRK